MAETSEHATAFRGVLKCRTPDYRFVLRIGADELPLLLKKSVRPLAEALEDSPVIVRGDFDEDQEAFRVDQLIVSIRSEAVKELAKSGGMTTNDRPVGESTGLFARPEGLPNSSAAEPSTDHRNVPGC